MIKARFRSESEEYSKPRLWEVGDIVSLRPAMDHCFGLIIRRFDRAQEGFLNKGIAIYPCDQHGMFNPRTTAQMVLDHEIASWYDHLSAEQLLTHPHGVVRRLGQALTTKID